MKRRGILPLFLFEFTVVVLGVLTAQALQNWSQERERQAQADRERVRLEQGFLAAVDHARVWRANLPCLRQRVGDVMRSAGSGTSLEPDLARRPKLPFMSYEPASDDVLERITGRIGTPGALSLADMQTRIETIGDAQIVIRSQWELFRLLDPEFGQPRGSDRSAVRAAGASILAELRSIENALDMIDAQAGEIEARSLTPFDIRFDILPIRSCAELWAKGTAYRTLDPGETPPR